MWLVQPAAQPSAPSPGAGPYTVREIEAMQRTVIAILARWGVTDAQAAVILGDIAPKTFRRWKAGEHGRVNRDLADRLSLLIGIHRALRIIFTDPGRGYAWMRRANDAFGGRTPLELLLGGGMSDLVRLRRYLDSVRGG